MLPGARLARVAIFEPRRAPNRLRDVVLHVFFFFLDVLLMSSE